MSPKHLVEHGDNHYWYDEMNGMVPITWIHIHAITAKNTTKHRET